MRYSSLIAISILKLRTGLIQGFENKGFIAVDYCPSEKDVLLPFHSVHGPYDADDWSKCATMCQNSDHSKSPPSNMIHVPNTYCKYYASGGDGPNPSSAKSSAPAVTFCEHYGCNSGFKWELDGPMESVWVGEKNDKISEIVIQKGWKLQVFQHSNFEGRSKVFEAQDSAQTINLGRHNMNDEISSFKIYKLGGDGPCESGRSFNDVWQQCNEDGPDKCMGVMWNSCGVPTSNTSVNGAWKLMDAGQDVGDADNPTADCGGKYKAAGYWDVFLRGPEQCQFAYFNDGKCYIYGRKVVNTSPLELEPSTFQRMDCDTSYHGSGGLYVVREFQYVTQYGKEVPVGDLGHKLRDKINKETAMLDDGAFETNISMEIDFLDPTFTRFCANNVWRSVRSACKCGLQIRKAKGQSGCGSTYGSIKVKWLTSLDKLGELVVQNISVGDFWRSGIKDHVISLLNKSAVQKGEAYDELKCGSCCMGCSGPRKSKRASFSSLGYKSEMMPEKMDFKLVRYKQDEINEGEVVDIISNFRYEIEGLDKYVWDQSSTGQSYCSGASPALSATLGAFGLLFAPVGLGPIFGALSLANTVGCMASATAPSPVPGPAPAPTPAPSSCMAGKTGVSLLPSDAQTGLVRSSPQKVGSNRQITKVRDLQVNDIILGLDESKTLKECQVEAVGSFGFGPVYGNYTDDHFVLNPSTGNVEVHGKKGNAAVEDKYIVLTSCPIGLDESGIGFTPFDSDFFGDLTKDLTWGDYLLLHTAILRVVRETGTFWFDGSSYKDLHALRHHAPHMGMTLLQCMKDHNDCEDLENASILFIERTLSDHAKIKAFDTFHNLGRHGELGSAASIVSAGKSLHSQH